MNNKAENSFHSDDYDDEEREILADLQAGLYVPVPDQDARKRLAQQMAQNTLRRKSVTIRMQERLIDDLKQIASLEGMPYQTLISSVLHKYIAAKQKELRE
jgi:predicted DNA binding CopG/RHH family protein